MDGNLPSRPSLPLLPSFFPSFFPSTSFFYPSVSPFRFLFLFFCPLLVFPYYIIVFKFPFCYYLFSFFMLYLLINFNPIFCSFFSKLSPIHLYILYSKLTPSLSFLHILPFFSSMTSHFIPITLFSPYPPLLHSPFRIPTFISRFFFSFSFS